MEHIHREKFLSLTNEEVAKILRAGGSRVCVLPFNGTRRWFLLEYGRDYKEDAAQRYVEVTIEATIRACKLIFDHGIDTFIMPVFGGEIMDRGEEYMREIGAAMILIATHPVFIDFYKEYDIRIHFYGDYCKQLAGTPYEHVCNAFDEITRQTAHHKTRRLFYGVCGDDATETIGELAVGYYQEHGAAPSRRQLIEMYYGEYIEKADVFIGYEKFNVFDYPMLGWGEESLYYMAAPSFYLNQTLLRKILYDYIYLRPVQDPDYFTMPEEDFEAMRHFYQVNREVAFGVGEMRGGIWYSKSGVKE
jgi:tuberculosinol/isotuberculosinol synthase